MLRPHLTAENAAGLLERAVHRTKSQIEELLAELAPRPDVPAVIRRLPVASAPAPAATPSLLLSEGQHRPDGVASTVTSAAVVQPLAPERYKVQFTAGADLRRKLERLQKLMSADLAQVIERAVTEKLERLERKRFGLTKAPRKNSLPEDKPTTDRYVPAALKRRLLSRRRALPLYRRRGPTVQGKRLARVPPSASVCARRPAHAARRLPDVPRPQPVRGRPRLRESRDGATSVGKRRPEARVGVKRRWTTRSAKGSIRAARDPSLPATAPRGRR
jgi:hypothetical protein